MEDSEMSDEKPDAKKSDKKPKKPTEPAFSTHLQSYDNLASFPPFKKIFFEQKRDRNQWHRFVACTSLYNDGAVNINSASEDVVDILAKLHPLNADEVKKYLKGPVKADSPPPHYESLSKINELGHGQLKLSASGDHKKSLAKEDKNETKQTDTEGETGAEAENPQASTVPRRRNTVDIDVHCRVLRIDVAVQKSDTRFGLTGLVKFSSNNAVNEKRKTSSKNLTDPQVEPDTGPAYTSSGVKVSVMGVIEHGSLDY
jgi:hypothetical protein